jgi:hypothetical protein
VFSNLENGEQYGGSIATEEFSKLDMVTSCSGQSHSYCYQVK